MRHQNLVFHRAYNGAKMNLADRLKQVREQLGFTQKEMAKAISTNPQTWQVYEAGKSVPGGNVLEALARMGFNVNWILTGEGVMHRDSSGGWWSDKMKEIRGSMTIPEFVSKVGFSDPIWAAKTIKAIEDGNMEADFSIMNVLTNELGISVDWMFGWQDVPMMRKDTAHSMENTIGKDLIKEALQAVEEYLQEAKGTLPPDKKAELIMLLCEWHLKATPENKKINKATVIRLVKLAA